MPTNERADESVDAATALDDALADTFPASDPPSQTSPSAATPSASVIASGPNGEVRLFRVIEASQASDPFAPAEAGARWTLAGVPCVYASLSPATAMLEFLVHLEGRTPAELLLAVATIPAASILTEVNAPSTWCERPYRQEVQQVGADWIKARQSLGLRVPSAICMDESNVLLNPSHPGFAGLELVALRPLKIDERLRT